MICLSTCFFNWQAYLLSYMYICACCLLVFFCFICLPGFCKIGPVLHHVLAEFLLIHGIRSFRFKRESKQELDLVAMERPRPGGPVWDGRAVVELVKIDGTSGGLGVVLCKLYDWALKCEIPDYNREIYVNNSITVLYSIMNLKVDIMKIVN